jgi:hypothetical protein
MTDLVVALTLGALTGYHLLNVTPSSAPISELPLALIPTAVVPLLFALRVTSVSALVRAPRTALPATPLAAAAIEGEGDAAHVRCAQGGDRLAGTDHIVLASAAARQGLPRRKLPCRTADRGCGCGAGRGSGRSGNWPARSRRPGGSVPRRVGLRPLRKP